MRSLPLLVVALGLLSTAVPAAASDGADRSTARSELMVAAFAAGAEVDEAVEDAGADLVRTVPRLRAALVRTGDAERLRAQPGVRYVEPLVERHAFGVRTADATTPERLELGLVAAQAAVPASDGRGTAIAVLDTGVDTRNPDLAGRVVDRGDYTGDTGRRRATGGGVDRHGHGTGVAALAAAAADGQGMVGVAPAAAVHSYKVLDDEGAGGSVGLALAIRQVADDAAAGAPIAVANMSLGGPFRSRIETDALAYAAQRAPQVLFVAASGNDGGVRPSFPAASPRVLSVGASQRGGDGTWRRAAFSNTADVDVLAPGAGVLTYRYVPSRQAPRLGLVSGTSEAAPQVAGLVAGLAAGRGVRGQAAATALKAAAEPAAGGTGEGSGRADALTAVTLADGARAYSTVFADDGAVVDPASQRTLVTRRFVPSGAAATPAPLTTTAGTLTPGASTSSPAPGGTLVSQQWRFRPPASEAARGSWSTVSVGAQGSEVHDAVPFATLPQWQGERGRPVRSGERVRATLGPRSGSALLVSVGVQAGQSFTVRASGTAGLFVWAPEEDGRARSTFLEPDDEVTDLSRPATYRAPWAGRFVVGFVVTRDSGPAAEHTLTVDHPEPVGVVRAPRVSAATTAGLPFRVSWSGGVRHDVQWTTRTRTAAGWTTGPWRTWLRGTPASSAVFGAGDSPTRVQPGTTYHLRVVATDQLGDTGAPSASVATAVPLDDRDPALRYGTGWQSLSAADRYLGTLRSATTPGRTVSLTGDAAEVLVVGERCPTCGPVAVVLDGRRAVVDTRGATTRPRQVLWRSGPLPGGIRSRALTLTTGTGEVRLDGVALVR